MIEFDMLVMIVIIGIVIVARLVWARWLSLFLFTRGEAVHQLRDVLAYSECPNGNKCCKNEDATF